jgi:hypothetical protein
VAGGALDLRFADSTSGIVLLRARGRGDAVEEPLSSGAARLELPAAASGDIFDVLLRSATGETRLRSTGSETSDDPTWRVYGTEHGNLSVKRVPASLSATPARNGAESLGGRALRRLRRSLAERAGDRSA